MNSGKISHEPEFADYLRALRNFTLGEKTEHTDRSAIEALLNAFSARAQGKTKPKVQHEPKKATGKGAPDFKITKSGMILGYVETKTIGENLTKVLKSDQLKRYRELSSNILLTDYLEWIWIRGDANPQTETLCHETDLENRKFKLREDRIEAVANLIEGFFSTAPEGIGRSQQLALALATRSKYLRDYLTEELIRQEREHKGARLYGLFEIFRDQVFHDLKLGEFADAFAQMLAYGLFLARLNAKPNEDITLRNAREHVPGSFRLIQELVDFLGDLEKDEYRQVRWVVEEVLSIVNGLDLASIHKDLSYRQRKAISRKVRATDEEEHRLFERDPFIYFYEDYLKAYDPAMRKGRGVYYTPPPIVNFIIRAVDDILKDSFGIKDGLADNKRVTVLDFACGTGTFLLEAFQRIFENVGGADSGKADLIVREHILKHLYGFEYLIAPYTIAHLKLSQYLLDKGHPLTANERLQVFLTNTLEPVEPIANRLLPELSAETHAAQGVKETPIRVITGNPPYSGHSKNKGQWITASIDEYKFTLEKTPEGLIGRTPLGEKNPKWLQDDYVKFIRFAQMKMDGFSFTTIAPDGKLIEHAVPGVDSGIVGIITNNSWLDNPTFRGMRQSLMRSFNQIYVLDLHGDINSRAPDGTKDENVFDIKQGVAISLFVKHPDLEHSVQRADLWGERLGKYQTASESSLQTLTWDALQPVTPFYLFAKQDLTLRDEYQQWSRLTDIFPINVLGFQTHRDAFAISFTEFEMAKKLQDFADRTIADDEMTRRYGLKSNRDWSLSDSRAAAYDGAAKPPQLVAYRPFDHRWSEFSSLTMDYPRRELLEHVAGRENLELLAPRGISTQYWRHSFVADQPANDCVISDRSREANQVFPLWRFAENVKSENLSVAFRAFIDARYDHQYDPEDIFGYVYAILNAPTYRACYADFLRIDFPRIPFAHDAGDFERLAKLGWGLVQAHLLREVPQRGLAQFDGKGDYAVETVRYSEQEQAIWINKNQCFKPVPQNVWEFHIGGYQVLDKYLKSRKGRKLSLDEINHVAAVTDSLAFTIDQMARIDEAYQAAFPDRG